MLMKIFFIQQSYKKYKQFLNFYNQFYFMKLQDIMKFKIMINHNNLFKKIKKYLINIINFTNNIFKNKKITIG